MAVMGVLDRPHPADVRVITGVTSASSLATIVRVSTRDRWTEIKDEFFVWYDQAKNNAGFTYDSDVAKAAKMSHTSISGWRTGRQRPNAQSLSAVAAVLKQPAREAWARAGLLTEADLAEAPVEDHWGVEIIKSSARLDAGAKAKLIAIFLEQERRDREEKERRLREQIEIAGG